MNDYIDVILIEYLFYGILVPDIGFNKSVVVPVLHTLKVFKITSISKRIHIDDPDAVLILAEHIIYKIRADKTGASSNQISTHIPPQQFLRFDTYQGSMRQNL